MDKLDQNHLQRVYSYSPTLSASWLFHKAMFFENQISKSYPKNQINNMLDCNFYVSTKLSKKNTELFVREKIRFHRLLLTMTLMPLKDMKAVLISLRQIGLATVLNFFGHFIQLGIHQLYWRILSLFNCQKRFERTISKYKLNSGY